LRGIAIVAENEKALEFDFSIKNIELVYKEEFADLSQKYSRPFFIHAQDSYKNAKTLDTGKETLTFEEDKFSERKKAVNDLFSEEEIAKQRQYKAQTQTQKSFFTKSQPSEEKPSGPMTIKERLAKKLNNKQQ